MSSIVSHSKFENRIIYNNKYERLYQNPISNGAFGWVFLVKDITNGEKYILKIFFISVFSKLSNG